MTYLGIDLGNKRVGIATSSENIAFPKAIVQRTHIISYLKKLFIELPECRDVVIGLPYDLYGIDSRQLDRTHKFIDKLKEIFPNKIIHGHDERFTSFQAGEGGFSDHRDDIAAQCILQSFLDTKR